MSIIKKNSMISINGKEIFFKYNVDTVLEFPKYFVILLMGDDIPDDNVEAIDYNGNRIWNISQIIKFSYPESYVSLSKETGTSFSVVSYSGVKFVIDILTHQIINKSILK